MTQALKAGVGFNSRTEVKCLGLGIGRSVAICSASVRGEEVCDDLKEPLRMEEKR